MTDTTKRWLQSDASFSPCGTWRYLLSRWWDHDRPMGVFVGINPSTAGADDEDQTTRKMAGFARRFGWGGYWLVNPFALVSTDQRGLLSAADPVGPDNEDCFVRTLTEPDAVVVVAWGRAKTNAVRRLLDERLRALEPLISGVELKCLGTTEDGSPRHPLMLPYATKLQPWTLEPTHD